MKKIALAFLLCCAPIFAAQQVINVGSAPNDGTGDTARAAFQKVNANFSEVYTGFPKAYPGGYLFTSPLGFTTPGLLTSGGSLALVGDTSAGAATSVFSFALDTTNPTLQMFRPTTWGTAQAYTTTLLPYIRGLFDVSGTVTSGSAFFSQVSIAHDSVATVAGGGPGGASVLYLSDNMSSASLTGNRVGLTTQIVVNNTTGNTDVGPYYYVGGSMQCYAHANDNGIAGSGNSRGNCFGSNPIARLYSGATFYQNVAGEEIDVSLDSGSSAAWKDGLRIVKFGTDAVQGTNEDAAIVFADQVGASVGWKNLIQIGSPTGQFPVNGGSIMTTATTLAGGPAYSVAHGIDFSGLTCTSDCFKSTGFTVDGSGNTTVASLAGVTDASAAAAGKVGEVQSVDCSTVTTATVTMTIASPAVVTWSSHPFSAVGPTNWTCPINFTTSGALPTGIVAGTNYYIDGATLSGDTFELSDTAAHALAGTNHVNTSGSQSGTQTGQMGALATSLTVYGGSAMNLTAGDWDCQSIGEFIGLTSVTATSWYATVHTAAGSLPSPIAYSQYRIASGSIGTANTQVPSPTVRENISSTTGIYGGVEAIFSAGTQSVGSYLRCRRMR